MAKRNDWDYTENMAVCTLWCRLFIADLQGHKLNKSAERRALIGTDAEPGILNNRSHGSIEAKLMNVSAAAQALGLPALPGYKPAPNYQGALRLVLAEAIDATGLDFAPEFRNIGSQ